MSTYESDPNKWDGSLNTGSATPTKADPVGKRYGAKDLGSVGGSLRGGSAYEDVTVEIRKTEVDALADVKVRIPAYSTVTEIWTEVTEAFGTGDAFDIHLDGNDLTASPIDVTSTGLTSETLTATSADLSTGSTEEDLTIDGTSLDDATTTGVCKVVVRYIKA